MTKYIEVTGKTEDDAIESALRQLGLTRDDVSVEIVEQAKSGFLGLKNTPAIVRVSYEAEDEEPEIAWTETTGAEIAETRAGTAREERPDGGARIEHVEKFLTGLLTRMDVDAGLQIAEEDGAINVVLTGRDPGILIGRRGETLDAIQHLTTYVVNRGVSGRVRVNLDAENYRARRNETLETLASRTAGKVVKYRRNMTLDPMNAYERHVVHTALQDYEGVTTYSIGSEPNRRIVVSYGRGGEKGERYERPVRPVRDGAGASSGRPAQPAPAKKEEVRENGSAPGYREWK